MKKAARSATWFWLLSSVSCLLLFSLPAAAQFGNSAQKLRGTALCSPFSPQGHNGYTITWNNSSSCWAITASGGATGFTPGAGTLTGPATNGTALIGSNNLSDIATPATALANLGGAGLGANSFTGAQSVTAATSNVMTVRSSGSNFSFLTIDNQGSQQSVLQLSDAGSLKWQFGKNATNTFFIYDIAHSRNLMTTDTSGNLQIWAGGNIVYRCATAGALPIGALTINAASCGTTADTALRLP